MPADEIRSDGFKVLFFDNIINKTSYVIKDAKSEPLNATTIRKGAPALFILVKRDIAWLALGIMLIWVCLSTRNVEVFIADEELGSVQVACSTMRNSNSTFTMTN